MDMLECAFLVLLNFANVFFLVNSIRLYVLCFLSRRYRKKIRELMRPNHELLDKRPFVSIMIPTYNEKNVVDRILEACLNIDYDNFEVVVVDDSTDETVRILRRWAKHPKVKVIHREHRTGWKGGALDEGLKHLDPRSEFVLIFDADFIPPRDIIKRMLSCFVSDEIAAVQGYHLAILNADENWITRAGRMVLTYAYAIDYPARFALGGAPQLGGSVMMIRRGVLEEVGGFGTSITEDYDLALRLYIRGYRIFYDESIKVPCECPSTLRRFIRQQSRWVEGRARDFRRRLKEILRSDKLSWVQKLDMVMDGITNFSAMVVLIWGVVALVGWTMGIYVPIVVDFTSISQWVQMAFLIFSGASYPLAHFFALKREGVEQGSTKKWIAASLMVMYLLLPFLMLASLRGAFVSTGYFHRTYKTGKIIMRRMLKPSYWRRGALDMPYGYEELLMKQPALGALGWPSLVKYL